MAGSVSMPAVSTVAAELGSAASDALLPSTYPRSAMGNGAINTGAQMAIQSMPSTEPRKVPPSLALSRSWAPGNGSYRSPVARGALAHRGAEWRWLNTISFFAATCFGIGAIFFCIGAATSMALPRLDAWAVAKWKERVLIDYSYAIGGVYFTIGSYLSFFEVINVGLPPDDRRLFSGPSGGTSASGYWGTLIYFIGASAFQIAVLVVLLVPDLPFGATIALSWLPQVAGGVCFTVAAVIEQVHNAGATWQETVFWVCRLYLGGSVLFAVAAITGTVLAIRGGDAELATQLGVDLPYLIGSAMFLVGAWMQLQMWKAEQFGLGFIREINFSFQGKIDLADEQHRYALVEQLSLALYMANGALAALNVCLAYVWHAHADFERVMLGVSLGRIEAEALLLADELMTETVAFLASHCMLLLATAVHFTPSLQPYGHLLWLMRAVAVVMLANAAVRCLRYLNEGTACVANPSE